MSQVFLYPHINHSLVLLFKDASEAAAPNRPLPSALRSLDLADLRRGLAKLASKRDSRLIVF
jgi:hypothetical protein